MYYWVNNVSDKPVAAFILGLIAGIFGILSGIGTLIGLVFAVNVPVPIVGSFGTLLIILGLWWLIAGIIIIVGSTWINSGVPSSVRKGGIVVLIFSILSLPNWLTFILGLIGGILALVWKPPIQQTQPPPPPSGGEQVI